MSERIQINPSERLVSLDAYRGFTMLLMASSGFGITEIARQFSDNAMWQWLSYHFSHVQWRGGGLWDMILPSFTFMVGVSMAYSYSKRLEKGQTRRQLAAHAGCRAFLLVALGVLLLSRWTFVDVLSRLGFGYFFLFLLWGKSTRVVIGACLTILVGYWALFAFWPLPPTDYDYAAVNVSADWMQEYGFTEFEAHWNKNANPAHYFDVWFLNLFPRKTPFTHNDGGYHTLSFIPSLATMILGLLAGELLRGSKRVSVKFGWLVTWGVVCAAAGMALDHAGICPNVKRICTPSWVLFSGGWSFLILAGFYGICDIIRFRLWAWVGVVVGLNSITMYVLANLIPDWIDRTIRGLLGSEIYAVFNQVVQSATATGGTTDTVIQYDPIVKTSAILFVLWLICWRMYSQRLFIRI